MAIERSVVRSVKIAGNADTIARVAHIRVIAQPAGGGQLIRIVAPRTAPQDPLAAVALQPGAAIRRGSLVGPVPAVGDPLGDAAVHVMQAERIGSEAADRRRHSSFVAAAAVLAVRVGDSSRVPPPE